MSFRIPTYSVQLCVRVLYEYEHCTVKLFSISIIIIENNFAGVHMSFRIPTYSVQLCVRVLYEYEHCTVLRTFLGRSVYDWTHVYTGEIVFYFHYHHRKQFCRCTHEFPDSYLFSTIMCTSSVNVWEYCTSTIVLRTSTVLYFETTSNSKRLVIFYFHYHHRKQFCRCTHEFPDSYLFSTIMCTSTVRVRALYCTPYIPRTVRVRLNSCVHRWNCFLFPLSSSKTILPVYTWVSGFLPIQYNSVYE